MILLQGQACDLDLQGSDQNVASETSSQYGDHFCEIVVKSDIEKLCARHDFTVK